MKILKKNHLNDYVETYLDLLDLDLRGNIIELQFFQNASTATLFSESINVR